MATDPFLALLEQAKPQQLFTPHPSMMQQTKKAREDMMSPVAKSVVPAPPEELFPLPAAPTRSQSEDVPLSDRMMMAALASNLQPDMTPEERTFFIDELKKDIDRQQSEIDKQREIAQLYLSGPGSGSGASSVTPILGLIDAWTGSNLAATQPKPQTPEDRAAMALKLQSAISDAEGKLSKEKLDLLKTQLGSGQKKMDPFALWNIAGRQERGKEAIQMKQSEIARRKEDVIRKDIQKISDEVAAQEEKLGQIQEAFATNDLQRVSSMLANFSRVVAGEKGVLTDNDIGRLVPDSIAKTITEKIAWLSKIPTGPLPEGYTQRLLDAVNTAREKIAEKHSTQLKRRWDDYTTGQYKDVAEIFKPAFESINKQIESFKPAKSSQPSKSSQQAPTAGLIVNDDGFAAFQAAKRAGGQ